MFFFWSQAVVRRSSGSCSNNCLISALLSRSMPSVSPNFIFSLVFTDYVPHCVVFGPRIVISRWSTFDELTIDHLVRWITQIRTIDLYIFFVIFLTERF